MGIRNDFTINWQVSPRIITVNAPSTSCTMQDLYDTIRFMEASSSAMDNASLGDASGKEPLDDAGTKVGITVSLNNAKLGFEARTDWTNCSLAGGNLVAYNDVGGIIDPINPTAYVNITRTSSASATLQEQDALQYASYGGAVTIDVSSDNTGIEFPSGTQEHPVNNVADALLIAEAKGFHSFMILGHVTVCCDDVIDNYKFLGHNIFKSILTIEPDAVVTNCEIKECTVRGVLDGNCIFRECNILDIQFFSGIINNCGLNEQPIVLGGGGTGILLNTFSLVAGLNTPTIDMNGSGNGLAVRGHSGGLKVINKGGQDPCSIDMASGHLIFDETVTNGTIYARGAFKLTDNSQGAIIDVAGRIHMADQNSDIADAVWAKTVMTVGAYMKSLSTADDGATALNVVANITGTYPVFTPFDSFEVTFDQPMLDANLHVETLEANLDSDSLDAELMNENLVSDLYTDTITGDLK